MSKIILFDGVCNFCNRAVTFVIDHDARELYLFASLQSERGQKYLQKFNLPLNDFDTFILIDGDEFYTSSTAALMVSRDLSGLVKFLYPLIYIPKFVRDILYRCIAKNRYVLFGKSDVCRTNAEKDNSRFLS